MQNSVTCENWLISLKDRVLPQTKQEWKQENTDDLTDFENAMMHIGGSFFGDNAGLDPNDTNAIKEQANLLLELIPSKEWSEEDINKIDTIIGYIASSAGEKLGVLLPCINWLEELRDIVQPQSQWKPSEEQMKALEKAHLRCPSLDEGLILGELIKQLKKLR